jgi:hypothetical protein
VMTAALLGKVSWSHDLELNPWYPFCHPFIGLDGQRVCSISVWLIEVLVNSGSPSHPW